MRPLIVRLSRSPWLTLPWLVSAAVVAVVLTFFAIFRIGANGSPLSFRHHDVWRSTQTLRLIIPRRASPAASTSTSLGQVYAQYASSGPVLTRVLRDGPLKGSYEVSAARLAGKYLPGLEIRGFARSRAHAGEIARRISRALRMDVTGAQDSAQIPIAQRVRFEVASSAKTERTGTRRLVGTLSALALVLGLLTLAVRSGLRRP